jgi:hypothetical protein
MSEKRLVVGFVIAAALGAVVLTLAYRGRAAAPPLSVDPAIEHYLQGRTADYGAVDRWASHGMTQEVFAARMQQAGFTCTPLMAAQPQPELACTQERRWPVPRRLVVTGRIEHGTLARLVSARAESVVDTRALRPVATLLRKLGWIEPAQLAVRGFEIATPELLARYAADALKGGWAEMCGMSQSAVACAQQARGRRSSGFPAVDGGASAGDYDGVIRSLERVRLRPVRPPELAGVYDKPVVRVNDRELWLDFAGNDLAGHELRVAVLLAMEGGRPVKMVASVDGKSREVMLAGQPRRVNGGAAEYLVPRAGTETYRMGAWLSVPRGQDSWATRAISEQLPRSDPRFAAFFIKQLLDNLARPERPDMGLGMFPPLLMVERRADALRDSSAHRWLPQDVGGPLMRAAYPDHPTLRAAWVLAVCDPEPDGVGGDAECWRRETEVDPELLKLLREDLATLTGWYAVLPPNHPLHARLERWRRLLAG